MTWLAIATLVGLPQSVLGKPTQAELGSDLCAQVALLSGNAPGSHAFWADDVAVVCPPWFTNGDYYLRWEPPCPGLSWTSNEAGVRKP